MFWLPPSPGCSRLLCDTGFPGQNALMDTAFLDRLATQLKISKSAACRRAIQRILVRIKEHYVSGQYRSTIEAESEFRRLVESDLACK
jgi:hypothetical protein